VVEGSGADAAGDVGLNTSVAIGADNLPIVSYFDQTNRALKVAKCGDVNCTGTATITTVDPLGGGSTSIAIGKDGIPVISYNDAESALKRAQQGMQFLAIGSDLRMMTIQAREILDRVRPDRVVGDVARY
jgi:hypothetical protein